LEKEKIVDTNGAGDSFVGGFLFEIYRGNSVDVAVKTGSKLAREVVMRSGCTFPANFEI
jgi:adenosine kinase